MRSEANIVTQARLVIPTTPGADALLAYLSSSRLTEFLSDSKDRSQTPIRTDAHCRAQATAYAAMAWRKVEDHADSKLGIRVGVLASYAWLLGSNTAYTFGTLGLLQFRAPQLAFLCGLMGIAIPNTATITRMRQGLPCVVGCTRGCVG